MSEEDTPGPFAMQAADEIIELLDNVASDEFSNTDLAEIIERPLSVFRGQLATLEKARACDRAEIDALTKERDDLKQSNDTLAAMYQKDITPAMTKNDIEDSLRERAEKAEARVKELEVEIDKKQQSIKTLCRDWADDDTAIKNVCKPFGIDTEGDSYGVPCMADCVIQLGEKATALKARVARLETALLKADHLAVKLRAYFDGKYVDINNVLPYLVELESALGTNDATPKPNEGL